MKIVGFEGGGGLRLGVVEGDQVIDLQQVDESIPADLGEVLRKRWGGWQAYVFTGNPNLAAQLGMKPAGQRALFNGKIPCRLLHFDLASGC